MIIRALTFRRGRHKDELLTLSLINSSLKTSVLTIAYKKRASQMGLARPFPASQLAPEPNMDNGRSHTERENARLMERMERYRNPPALPLTFEIDP